MSETLETASARNSDLAQSILDADKTVFGVAEAIRLLLFSLSNQIAINRTLITEAKQAQQERRGRD